MQSIIIQKVETHIIIKLILKLYLLQYRHPVI
jgi:hypothetical protein